MKLLRNSQGIAIVYVTLFLMVLGILFFALGVDIGWMVYVKSQGQKATDAAALAGAAAIPNANTSNTQTKVNEMAMAFNANNAVMNASAGIASTDVELCDGSPNANPPNCNGAVLPAKAQGVKVTRTYNTPLFFTRFVNGAVSTDISVSSTAWLGGPATLPCNAAMDGASCLPISVCDQEIGYNPSAPGGPTCNPSIPIQFSPTGANNGAWWNSPGAGSTSASQCKGMVNGTIPIPNASIGDPIDLNNGQISSCMDEIRDRFMNPPANCSAATCALPANNAARIHCTAMLPIVACAAGMPLAMTTPVLGFAAICITNVISKPASAAVIDGNLNCNLTVQAPGGGTPFGIYANKPVLVE